MDKKETRQIIDAFITANYDNIIEGIDMKYAPDSEHSLSSLAQRSAFRRSMMSPEELAHQVMVRMMKYVRPEALEKIDEGDRELYLWGTCWKIAEYEYSNIVYIYRNRLRLAMENDLTQSLAVPPREQEDFELEEALSSLSPIERTLFRNREMTQVELYERMAGDSMCRNTFRTRMAQKHSKIQKVLKPE